MGTTDRKSSKVAGLLTAAAAELALRTSRGWFDCCCYTSHTLFPGDVVAATNSTLPAVRLANPCSRQTLAFMRDTVVLSEEPITTTGVQWLVVGGAKVTIIAPSITIQRNEVKSTPQQHRRAACRLNGRVFIYSLKY